jgi:hypothetical protein
MSNVSFANQPQNNNLGAPLKPYGEVPSPTNRFFDSQFPSRGGTGTPFTISQDDNES